MAKTIPAPEARRIINEHKKLESELKRAKDLFAKLEAEVVAKVNAMLDAQAKELAANIPVEELNRNKNGIRIKALKSAGFENVAQVASARTFQITNIEGIGEDSACTIKAIADDYIKKARENSHIRLSSEGSDPLTIGLITSLYKILLGGDAKTYCDYVSLTYEKTVETECEKLRAITTGLKRLFCSAVKREMAEDAYEYLSELLNSEYNEKIQEIKHARYDISLASDVRAVESFNFNPIPYYILLEQLCPGVLGDDNFLTDLPEELVREIQGEEFYSEGLRCSLRRYQEWGVKYILHQKKVLLGDEMGLGKTVQAIASMVSLRNVGATHFMVVCPASVLANWCREIEKHSDLRVVKVHGANKDANFEAWMKEGGVAVTTYETTASLKPVFYFHFTMLVVDEAHYIKNPAAARTKNVKRLAELADRLLFMTGTALENRVDEMITLMHILNPEVADEAKRIAFLSSAPQFRKSISPVYFRRKREDVLKELPDLIENEEWCTMSPAEIQKYVQTVYSGNWMAIRRVSWNVEDLKKSSKAARMLDIIEDAKEENRKVIVFSYFLDTIAAVEKLVNGGGSSEAVSEVAGVASGAKGALSGVKCMEAITGSVTPQRRQEILDEFEKAPAGTVLPAQIQSGGTGLNIQAASVVIICEPQLKPSIENQAISRAYRMGQTRSVLVFRLVCENSVDERIMEMLASKQSEFDIFADRSDAAAESIEIDSKTQGEIIRAEQERLEQEK